MGWEVGEHPGQAEKHGGGHLGGGGDGGARFLQVSLTQTFQSGCWLQAARPFPHGLGIGFLALSGKPG